MDDPNAVVPYKSNVWEASRETARPHIVDGEFQSDKYPTCPAGKVPLSVKDPAAQDLLWEYAQRHLAVDTEFTADLEHALLGSGFVPPNPPIPMLIWCPMCGTKHVDEGVFATKPHHTHECQNPECGLTWRHAKVPTVGVDRLFK